MQTETKRIRNFIGGGHADPAEGRLYDLVNPSTGEVFAQAPASGKEDVDRAFDAAEKAFEVWRDSTPGERQLALLKVADAIEERGEELVRAESKNTGWPSATSGSSTATGRCCWTTPSSATTARRPTPS